MKKFAIEIKWAFISIIIFLAWMTLEKQLGFHDEKIKWQMFFTMLIIFPNFILYYLALSGDSKFKDLAGDTTIFIAFLRY